MASDLLWSSTGRAEQCRVLPGRELGREQSHSSWSRQPLAAGIATGYVTDLLARHSI